MRGFFPALPVNLFFLLFPVFSFLNKIILAYFGRKCKKYLALSFNKYKGVLVFMGAGKSGHTERCGSGKAWAETRSRSAWNLTARSRKSSR